MIKIQNLIDRVFSKKVLLISILIIIFYVVSAILIFTNTSYPENRDYALLNIYAFPLNYLGSKDVSGFIIILLPIIFIFLIIASVFSNRVFKAWRLWTGIWLIPFSFLIYKTASEGLGSGGLGVAPNFTGLIYGVIFGIYSFISIIVILSTLWREKHNK